MSTPTKDGRSLPHATEHSPLLYSSVTPSDEEFCQNDTNDMDLMVMFREELRILTRSALPICAFVVS